MKKNPFGALLLVPLTMALCQSCAKEFYNSAGSQPQTSTVIVDNPLWGTLKLNSVTSYVRVKVKVVILALNANTGQAETYDTATKTFNPGSYGTSMQLYVSNVDFPSHGPFTVQVFIESLDCNAFAYDCSSSAGGKQNYFGSTSVGASASSPYSIVVMSSQTESDCCN